MAIQVNKEITTNNGFVVEPGSYIRSEVRFPYDNFNGIFVLHWFKDLEEYQANPKGELIPSTTICGVRFTKTMTEAEFNALLSATDTGVQFNQFVIDYLSSFDYFEPTDFQIVN